MLTFLNNLTNNELTEIARQANIDPWLPRHLIVEEIEEDYWKSLYEAVNEHSQRCGENVHTLINKYFYNDI